MIIGSYIDNIVYKKIVRIFSPFTVFLSVKRIQNFIKCNRVQDIK